MSLLVALLLAIFVLPAPWGLVAVGGAGVIEVAEAWFWIRLSRRRPAQTGAEALVGRTAEVVAPCWPDGSVRVAGELWKARCEGGAAPGDRVRVVAIDGLTLIVGRER